MGIKSKQLKYGYVHILTIFTCSKCEHNYHHDLNDNIDQNDQHDLFYKIHNHDLINHHYQYEPSDHHDQNDNYDQNDQYDYNGISDHHVDLLEKEIE